MKEAKSKRKWRTVPGLIAGIMIVALTLVIVIKFPELPGIERANVPEGSSFQIDFVDVGQGDCAIVICDGAVMMIDGGSPEASSKVYTYLKARGITRLDYIVASHPDSDHIGGLSAALNAVDEVGCAYSPVTEHDSKSFENFIKYLGNFGLSPEIPKTGSIFSLGNATVQVLGPLAEHEDTNDDSIVLRIVYGKTSFLFTGDAENTEESELLSSGKRIRSTLLKVAHHGSSSSTSAEFLAKVRPEYALISVGRNNDYGHPTQEVLERLSDAGVEIWRTDEQGTITVESDGRTLSLAAEKDSGSVSQEADDGAIPEGTKYIGNIYSKKFHSLDCTTLPKSYNRVYFTSREEAVSEGYSPCGSCRP